MSFSAPEMLTVRPGDTLAVLAKRHAVTVADLKSWNGLVDDTIEVDQVLLIWTVMPAPRRVAERRPAPSALRATLDSVLGTEPAPVPAPAPAPTGVAAAEPVRTPVTIALPEGRVTIERPALVGLLGMEIGPDLDLEAAAAGMQRHDADLGGGGLGDRSLSAGSSADDLVMAERRQITGPRIPNTPVSAPRLTKPAAKRCLGGPSATMREDGVVLSQGLTVPQINAGMAQISRHVVRCFPPGTKGGYTMIVEITAGCDGRVSNVYVQNAGAVPANVASCVQQTLAFASFPAHAVPNGVDFQYPMKFTF